MLGCEDTASRMNRLGRAELDHGRQRSLADSLARIDAVTPAEVQIGPSAMKIRSSSTRTAGCSCCSRRAWAQWVVAARPSSSPASARAKAPVQTPATRRDSVPASAIQPRATGERACGRTSPTTSSVSGCAPIASVSIRGPSEERAGRPSSETTVAR